MFLMRYGGTLKFVPDNYKNKTMCNQAVDKYAEALECML